MVPVRMCVGCRLRAPQTELLRIIAADGVAVLDAERRSPGRGAYLHASERCLSEALRRRAIRRALRADVGTDELAAELARFAARPVAHQHFLRRG